MAVTGPTQTDRLEAESKWKSRPRAAKVVRAALLLFPFAMSIVFSVFVARNYPAERLEMNRWVWWIGVSLIATVILRLMTKLSRRLAPIAVLLQLSLIFPDQAPSRFSTAMRTGTTRQLSRRLDEVRESGRAFSSEENYAQEMLDMVAILNDHDRLTRGHSERVRTYTDLIAEELELDPADAEKLHWAALLHDLGKITVPPEILNKPGRPTDEEWKVLQGHPAAGQVLAEPLANWLGEWRFAIGDHHERWDGNGYPNGKSGAQTHISARILAVADAYDVMTSARSYKKGLSPELAREEVARNAGTQFDPEVVRAFLNVGLGELRAAAGPVAWLFSLPGVRSIAAEIGTTASTGTATAATAAATATAAAVVPAVVVEIPEEPPPPIIAFTAAPELLDGVIPVLAEDNSATGYLTFGGDGELTLTITNQPENGTASIGEIERGPFETETAPEQDRTRFGLDYQPNMNFNGADAFDVQVCDSNGQCITESVTFDVLPVNDAPTAGQLSFTVAEGASAVLTLDGGGAPGSQSIPANDAEGDDVQIAWVGEAIGGTVTATATRITFTQNGSEDRVARFSYRLTDATDASGTLPASGTVQGRNDLPLAGPQRSYATQAVAIELPADELLAGSDDPDGDVLYVARVAQVTGGSATATSAGLIFTPDADFVGEAEVTFVIADGNGGEVEHSVSVTVTALPTPPVVNPPADPPAGPPTNQPPGTAVSALTVDEGASITTVSIPTLHSDPEGNAISLSTVTPPAHGTATATPAGAIVYVHDGSETTSDTITYLVRDSAGALASGTINVTVNPVNDAPAVVGATWSIVENAAPGDVIGAVAATDVESSVVAFELIVGHQTAGDAVFAIDNAGNVSLTGLVALNAATKPQWVVAVAATDDGGATGTGTITVNVTEFNDPPTIDPGQQFSIDDGFATDSTVGALTGDDPDTPISDIVFSITGGNDNGIFEIESGGTITVANAAGLNFDDVALHTLEVQAADDADPPNVATATVQVKVQSRFTLSPHQGKVQFNEVLTYSRFGHEEQFVEVINTSASPVDISGWTMADHDVVAVPTTEADGFAFTTDATVLAPGGRAVLWMDSNYNNLLGTPGLAEAITGEGGQPLDRTGDDLFLFDSSGRLVAYMAWGATNGAGIGFQPPISTWSLWNPNFQSELESTTPGQSIAVSPDGQRSHRSACWELTGTGAVQARGNCADATPTIDVDIRGGRTTSVGATNTVGGGYLKISEYSTDDAYEGGDFIEIVNTTDAPLALDGYRVIVYRESATPYRIYQVDYAGYLLPGQRYLMAHRNSDLVDDGVADQEFLRKLLKTTGIELLALDGTIADRVGNQARGGLDPVAASPVVDGVGVLPLVEIPDWSLSYERWYGQSFGNCVDTDNNFADFHLSYSPTPQGLSAERTTCGVPTIPGPAGHLVIREFRNNGPDGWRDDFIEIFNPTNAPIDLDPYEFHLDGSYLNLPAQILAPGETFLIADVGFVGPAADLYYSGGPYLITTSAISLRIRIGPEPAIPVQTISLVDDIAPLSGNFDQSYVMIGNGCVFFDNPAIDFVLSAPSTPSGTSTIEPC